MTKEFLSKVMPVVALAPLARSASATGVGVDTLGAESLNFHINVGSIADNDVNFAVELHESDDNVSYEKSDARYHLGSKSFDETAEDSVVSCAYIGNKKWVRIVLTTADNTGTFNIGVVGVKGDLHSAPDNAVNLDLTV